MNIGKIVLILIAGALLTSIASQAFAQEQEGTAAERAYFKAYYQEKALRDFQAAHDAYDEVIRLASAGKERDVHFRAVLGRARCLLPLGRNEEAIVLFKWVLDRDPENEEARAALAREQDTTGKEEDFLSQRIQGLVVKLGGAERNQAMKDLLLVGNRAVPQLAAALRSRGVGVVEGAARALATIGSQESLVAFAGGFADEGVVFPRALVAALLNVDGENRRGLEVFLAAMEHSDSEQRVRVLDLLAQKLSANMLRDAGSPGVMARILELGLKDPAPETKVAVLRACQRNPAAFRAAGSSPLDDEAWIELITSPEPNVSWNAAAAVSNLKSSIEHKWSPELCRAFVDALLDISAGRRSPEQAGYYSNTIIQPQQRHFRTEDLLDLFAAVAESDKFPENDRKILLDRIKNFLIYAIRGHQVALTDLRREGWSRIQSPVGRELWLERFSQENFISREIALEAAGSASPAVRRIAYQHLRRNQWRLEVEVIEGALTHLEEDLLGDDWQTRAELLSLMQSTPIRSGVGALRELLSKNIYRSQPLTALVRAIGDEALPEVRASLAGNDWQTARDLLVQLLGVKAVPELIDLAKRLKDGASPVVSQYRKLCIPSEVAREYVEKLPLELRNNLLVYVAAPALTPEARVELVLYALKSGDRFMIRAGAEVAGNLHMEEAWPYLIPLLDDIDESLRASAKTALTAIRTYRELKASFANSGPGGDAKVLEDAIKLTKDENPLKRRGGALALGALGNKAGIPVLLGLLDDADPKVREAALAALERLGGKGQPAEEEEE